MLHIRILKDRRLDVKGEDAREWLNGQLTCDVREASPSSATYGLLLSPQGKLMSDVWVLEHPADGDEQYFSLSLPEENVVAAHERLDRFLVMEDVELTFSDKVVLSIQGEGARAALEELGLAGVPWPVSRLDSEGAELWLDQAEADAALRSLKATERSAFEDDRVRAGVAAIGIDMGEDTLPQEVGMRNAVSFTKGCYVGQEPVIMLEHRGKPPKRLVHLHVQGANVGDPILSAGKTVGRITSVHSTDDLALGLVRRKHLDDALVVGDRAIAAVVVIEDASPGVRSSSAEA